MSVGGTRGRLDEPGPRRRRGQAPLAITAIPSPTHPSLSVTFDPLFSQFPVDPSLPKKALLRPLSPRPGTSTSQFHLPVPRPGLTSHPRHIYLGSATARPPAAPLESQAGSDEARRDAAAPPAPTHLSRAGTLYDALAVHAKVVEVPINSLHASRQPILRR